MTEITAMNNTPSAAALPIDLIENQILLRLPVKSILRCKSVCKLWYSVIKSPKFITNHYRHQSRIHRTVPIAVENLLVRKYPPVPMVFNPPADAKPFYAVWPITDGESVGGGNLSIPYYLGLPIHCLFVRPVNGFLLILLPNKFGDGCRMAMFNPATREFCQLTEFPFTPSDNNRRVFPPYTRHHRFGFGICKQNNSITASSIYKVVWLSINPDIHQGVVANNEGDLVVAKVYTIGGAGEDVGGGGAGAGAGAREGGWRTISAVLPRHFVMKYSGIRNHNVCVKGKCYWLSKDFSHILVFDLDGEVFEEMESPVPNVYRRSYNDKIKIHDAVFSEVPGKGEGDSLALFVFDYDSGSVSISVLDLDENENDNDNDGWHWTQHTVTCIDRPRSDLFDPLLQFEFPITDSTLLLKFGTSTLALYDHMTNQCLHFCKNRSGDLCSFVTIFNLRESLFSVEGGKQVSDCVLKKFYTFEDV